MEEAKEVRVGDQFAITSLLWELQLTMKNEFSQVWQAGAGMARTLSSGDFKKILLEEIGHAQAVCAEHGAHIITANAASHYRIPDCTRLS